MQIQLQTSNTFYINNVNLTNSFYVTFLQTFPKTDLLLDSESQGSGVFLPELDEPEYCNAQNTALWELHALWVRVALVFFFLGICVNNCFPVFLQIVVIARVLNYILFWGCFFLEFLC